MRIHNFNPGPSALPLAAKERAQREMLDIDGTGISILEHSHRERTYEAIHREAIALLRSYLQVPETHEIIFMQGGGRMQFAFVPLNMLKPGQSADYVITGAWAKQAYEEAQRVSALIGASVRKAGSTEVDGRFNCIPRNEELVLDPNAAYVHITTNNTIFGTQWHWLPETNAPLVADASSDIGTRSMDWKRFGLVYAGAQKNLGPAGVTVVIARKDWMREGRSDIPQIFQYRAYAESESLLNTPPVFAIYMVRNTVQELLAWGGLSAIEKESEEKARMIYDVIDSFPDFYRAPVEKESRSRVNIVFRLPTEELEKRFLSQAKERGFIGLKGHRSVGGIRASLYAALRKESAEALADFMEKFAKGH
ncbi:MAG: 3-phosphoserine/phosphohydroxythreonine transaminase [Sandaracinaceae bacterium]|nr:3-phosphoserine/phosphohydroxythreonine transaminase [Sandaracinaceae bacterium]